MSSYLDARVCGYWISPCSLSPFPRRNINLIRWCMSSPLILAMPSIMRPHGAHKDSFTALSCTYVSCTEPLLIISIGMKDERLLVLIYKETRTCKEKELDFERIARTFGKGCTAGAIQQHIAKMEKALNQGTSIYAKGEEQIEEPAVGQGDSSKVEPLATGPGSRKRKNIKDNNAAKARDDEQKLSEAVSKYTRSGIKVGHCAQPAIALLFPLTISCSRSRTTTARKIPLLQKMRMNRPVTQMQKAITISRSRSRRHVVNPVWQSSQQLPAWSRTSLKMTCHSPSYSGGLDLPYR